MKKDHIHDEIIARFKHYPPANPDEIAIHEDIRRILRNAATHLVEALPDSVVNSREFSMTLTDLENAMMHCNAAFARHKPEPE